MKPVAISKLLRSGVRLLDLGYYREPVFWLFLLLHAAYLAWRMIDEASFAARDKIGLLGLVIGFVSIALLIHLVHLLTGRHARILLTINSWLLFVDFALARYRVITRASLDFALLGDNPDEILYFDTLELVGMFFFTWQTLLPLVFLLLMMVFVQRRFGWLSRPHPSPNRAGSLGLYALLYLAAVLAPLSSHDEITYFLQTVVQHYTGKIPIGPEARRVLDSSPYPYLRPPDKPLPADGAGSRRPHVFLIIMESFNARYADGHKANGQFVTPNFDRVAREGVFVERFYGNSIDTARGQLAVLCSIAPSYRGKVFKFHPDLHLHCLPRVMADAGYATLFFRAFPDLEFTDTGAFMRRIGFDFVQAMDDEFIGPALQAQRRGWGLPDDLFFSRVFGYLDQRGSASDPDRSGADKPLFVTLMTVSNHYAFDEIPPDERLIFPEPKTAAERYANSVHLADRYLAVFFGELRRRDTLRDSLVILVGDHSFPTGEHGYSFNQIGYFEENFRTSLVLWWPDRLQPKRIGEGAWSQLDLAPSLMDLIGIQAENHFIGTSLFSAQPHAIPLIQPFDGKYLAVVRFPFKYVFHLRTGAERLFDLERDPQESVDLTDDSRGASRLVDLRRDLEMIFVNQSLIESDRIWPP